MRVSLTGAIVVAGLLVFATPAVATPDSDHEQLPCPIPSCETAVVATEDGQLLLIDATSGRAVRHLDFGPNRSDFSNGPPITAISRGASDDVYYSYIDDSDGTHGIWRTSLDGRGEPERVADGAAPAVSPDGRYLAYSFDPSGSAYGHGTSSIAIRHLDSGTERHVGPRSGDPDVAHVDGFIDSIAWSPDSSRLAYHLAYQEDPGAAFGEDRLFVFDLVTNQTLDEAGYVGSFASPSWGQDGLVAVERCCSPDLTEVTGRVVRFDLVSGRETEIDTTGGLPLEEAVADRVDVKDHYGDNLLVVRQGSGALDRIDGLGGVRRLRQAGYSLVAW